jgi:hypothetical protein
VNNRSFFSSFSRRLKYAGASLPAGFAPVAVASVLGVSVVLQATKKLLLIKNVLINKGILVMVYYLYLGLVVI